MKHDTTLKLLMKENINTVKQDQQNQKLKVKPFLGTVKELASLGFAEALLCRLCIIVTCLLNYTFYYTAFRSAIVFITLEMIRLNFK